MLNVILRYKKVIVITFWFVVALLIFLMVPAISQTEDWAWF